METWTLNHPSFGRITVERGYDVEFRQLYPDWPEDPPTDDDGSVKPVTTPAASAGYPERVRAWLHNPPARLQVSVDDQVVGRYKGLTDARIPLQRKGSLDEFTTPSTMTSRSGPHLKVHANGLGELLDVDFREGATVVEFDPPPGSRAERRRRAMESSNLKRVAYPLMAGMGKAGWAVLVLVLGPIVSRLLDALLPDWDVHLPSPPRVHLPVPPSAHLHLPVPHWPAVHWPSIDLPPLPAWLVWVLDHDRLWKPIVVGLVLGIIAVRNHRKSEREKSQWGAGQHKAPPDGVEPSVPRADGMSTDGS